MLRLISTILIIFLCSSLTYAIDTDSLEFELSNTNNKRRKTDLLLVLIGAFQTEAPAKVLEKARAAVSLAESIKYEEGLADAHLHIGDYFNHNNQIDSALMHYNIALSTYRGLTDDRKTGMTLFKIGSAFFLTSNYQAALQYTNESLEIFRIVDDKKQLAAVHSLLCDIKSYMGFKEAAIENCHISLELYESLKLDEGKASLLNSIGNIYLDLRQYEKARQYFNQALFLAKAEDDSYIIATSLSNLGHMHLGLGDAEEARKFYQRALELDRQENDLEGMGYSYYNLGIAFKKLNDFEKALENLQKSLEYSDQSVDLELQAKVYSEIGNLYSETGNYRMAISFLKQSLAVAQRIDADPVLQTCYNNLAKYYDKLGDQENALIYFKLYMLHREEMFNNQSALKIAEAEALYELANKEKQIQLLRSENRIKDLETAEKNLMNVWLITGLVFVFTLTVVVYRQYRLQNSANTTLQQQKEAIRKQKEEISIRRDDIEKANYILADKNRQITDSIEYAKRIQLSLLPDKETFSDYFSDSFVFYLPRDIVSGDFYWLSEHEDIICFAVIDCTGHGVPGAFMTVLANSLLNQIIIDSSLCQSPNTIIEILDRNVKEALNQHGITLSAFEGMDIACCVYNKKSNELIYSGAKVPLYLIRDEEFRQEKGNRFSVGGNEVEKKVFTSQKLKLKRGDILYLATDGYQDQFGGDKGKKFMKLHFRNLLKTIHHMKLSEQEKQLRSVFYEWKGSQMQTDDVLILGFRV